MTHTCIALLHSCSLLLLLLLLLLLAVSPIHEQERPVLPSHFCVWLRVCVLECMLVRVRMCVCIFACVRAYVHVCVLACVHMCVCICAYIYHMAVTLLLLNKAITCI